jgi:predicted TIM-barrel fold metal-dependent hydrolase
MDLRKVIDGDGHVFEDPDGISKFVPDMYKPDGPLPPLRLIPPLDHLHTRIGVPPPGSFRREIGAAEWLEFMDDVAMDAAVLYPTSFLAYGRITDPNWAIVVTRAYNDWLHETYLQRSPRFLGMGLIPMQDPEAAAAELRRVVEELGMCGAMLPSTGLKTHLGAKDYWPVYAEADRLGCALGVHGGCHGGLGMDQMELFPPVHALGHPFGLMINFGGLLFNGVLDHFPNVRWGFLEGGVSWLLLALERFTGSYRAFVPYDPRGDQLQLRPGEKVSDYIVRHVEAGRLFVGCEGDEPSLAYAAKVAGSRAFLFSSDFPHEVNNELCKEELDELRENAELSEAAKAGILHANAEAFYGLRSGAAQRTTATARAV